MKATIALFFLLILPVPAAGKPNIVYIMSDDHAANAEAVMAEIRRLMADGEAMLPPA